MITLYTYVKKSCIKLFMALKSLLHSLKSPSCLEQKTNNTGFDYNFPLSVQQCGWRTLISQDSWKDVLQPKQGPHFTLTFKYQCVMKCIITFISISKLLDVTGKWPVFFLFSLTSSSFCFYSLCSISLPMLYFLHLQLSFIVRIVPSPDWFVGVDSVDLCDGDHWKENVSLELFPYDAGTDSGFTFSSPNFETIPQDRITQVGQPEPRATLHPSQ